MVDMLSTVVLQDDPTFLIQLFGDNIAALKVVKRGWSALMKAAPVEGSSLRRAFDLRVAWLHDSCNKKFLRPRHVVSRWNPADLATKIHGRPDFLKLTLLCGIGYYIDQVLYVWASCPLTSHLRV